MPEEYEDEYEIHRALRNDINEGLVYIKSQRPALEADIGGGGRPILRITYENPTKKKRVIYCEGRWFSTDYGYTEELKEKSKQVNPKCPDPDALGHNVMFISEWYRKHLLGIDGDKSKILNIKRKLKVKVVKGIHLINAYLFTYFFQHPQHIVRYSAMCFFVGLGVALTGLGSWETFSGIGVESWKSFIGKVESTEGIIDLAFLVAGLFLVSYGFFAVALLNKR